MDARALPDGREELADTLDSYTVWPCAAPDQKRAIVHALQSRAVAMTGDGVNDVLALKDADRCGVGSAARLACGGTDRVAEQQFATLPHVVGEGVGSSAYPNGSCS